MTLAAVTAYKANMADEALTRVAMPPQADVNVLQIAAAGLLHGQLSAVLVRCQAGRAAVLFANTAFARLTGHDEAAVIGRDLSLLNGPHTGPAMIASLEQVMAGGAHGDVQILHYRADGQAFWNGITVIPAGADRDGALFLLLMRDTTAHHRAEDRLMALTDRLRDLAMSDPLTGVANRRSFDALLEQGWERARRTGRSLTLAMIDIDHFKQYNDQFGHLAGDQCLRAVAAALDRVIRRPSDCLARYGGEEFAILMPDMDAASAAAIAGRLVEAVRRAKCRPAGVAEDGGITISCGIASANPALEGGAPVRLVQEADDALYRAKAAGRNCVRQWEMQAGPATGPLLADPAPAGPLERDRFKRGHLEA